jgi:hypothetical protein
LKGEFHVGSRHSLCCVLSAALTVTAAAQGRPVESDQQVLIKLERSWNEAFYHKDVAVIENILADEFMATYDDGSRATRRKSWHSWLSSISRSNQPFRTSSR